MPECKNCGYVIDELDWDRTTQCPRCGQNPRAEPVDRGQAEQAGVETSESHTKHTYQVLLLVVVVVILALLTAVGFRLATGETDEDTKADMPTPRSTSASTFVDKDALQRRDNLISFDDAEVIARARVGGPRENMTDLQRDSIVQRGDEAEKEFRRRYRGRAVSWIGVIENVCRGDGDVYCISIELPFECVPEGYVRDVTLETRYLNARRAAQLSKGQWIKYDGRIRSFPSGGPWENSKCPWGCYWHIEGHIVAQDCGPLPSYSR